MTEIVKMAISFLLGISLGIVLGGLGKDLLKLTWKGEVGMDAFISLLSAAAIAIFLQQAFQKRVDSQRIEQNMLLDPLKEAVKHLREVRNDFRTCYNGRLPAREFNDRIVSNLRLLSNSLSSTRDLLDCLGHSTYVTTCDQLLFETVIYKQIITAGNPDDKFSGTDNQKQETTYRKLNSATHELLISVNRL